MVSREFVRSGNIYSYVNSEGERGGLHLQAVFTSSFSLAILYDKMSLEVYSE